MKIDIEYDEFKSRLNTLPRGFSFDIATYFDFDTAIIRHDTHRGCGEVRYQAIGFIGSRLYFLVFSLRNSVVRVISLRKANPREERFYEQETRSRTGR